MLGTIVICIILFILSIPFIFDLVIPRWDLKKNREPAENSFTPLDQAIKLLIEHGKILPPRIENWPRIELNGKEVIMGSGGTIFYACLDRGYYEDKYSSRSSELKQAFDVRIKQEEANKLKLLTEELLKELSK